ncbi:MAG TPA: MOSC domain-containing protein [Planctomycetaceae bacterium]|nr:MOSC domain-containing protein [Planctomycetaceae bacterium]
MLGPSSEQVAEKSEAHVVAVCISEGGVPKQPQDRVRVTTSGLEGDAQEHAKHRKPTRAVSLFDEEILLQLREEGYDVSPGSIGENITLRNVHVQSLPPGTILEIGEVRIRLEEPRKPCFVLDVIDERLKDVLVGRCGYMGSVLREGEIRPGMPVTVNSSAERLVGDDHSAR